MGAVSVKVAVGFCPVLSASCTRRSRRDSLVVIVVMSTVKVAAVTSVPAMVIDPVTALVRPTASAAPIEASSSETRKPTNVPVADS